MWLSWLLLNQSAYVRIEIVYYSRLILLLEFMKIFV